MRQFHEVFVRFIQGRVIHADKDLDESLVESGPFEVPVEITVRKCDCLRTARFRRRDHHGRRAFVLLSGSGPGGRA